MIERNLGNLERAVRVLLGVMLFGWAFSQPAINLIEWFVVGIAIALFLNGVFSRCYLWYVLDLNSCERGEQDCYPDSTC